MPSSRSLSRDSSVGLPSDEMVRRAVEMYEIGGACGPTKRCGASCGSALEHRMRLALEAAFDGFRYEHMIHSDGAGSIPANPATDRPCSRSRRLIGPWERL